MTCENIVLVVICRFLEVGQVNDGKISGGIMNFVEGTVNDSEIKMLVVGFMVMVKSIMMWYVYNEIDSACVIY